MKKFERLYKKSKTDAIVVCDIYVDGNIISQSTGQLDGAKVVHKTECFPKNVGRSNATTAEEQALIEAKAKHVKKIKDGYVLDESGETDVRLPMKVKKYQEQKKNVTFPCWMSPKLDGLNGEYRYEEKLTLFSRGGDPYPALEHMHIELREVMKVLETKTLNGEIYKHGMYLQDISSAVKKPNQDTPNLEFHVFEIPDDSSHFKDKIKKLREMPVGKYVKNIPMVKAESHDDIEKYFEKCLKEEFEGIIIRNEDCEYRYNVRSSQVFKYKLPEDGEYKIVGYKIDKNGHPVFRCITPKEVGAKEFNVKVKGTDAERKRIAENADAWIGQWLKIEYETLSKDQKPLKPVGICLRDCDANGNPLE